MLSKKETANFRQRLLDVRMRLDREVNELRDEALQGAGGEASGGLSNVPLHLGDLASHAAEQEVALGLVTREEHLREEIELALMRLEQGTYGRCEQCHKEIPHARLEALPYARLCVACAMQKQGKPA